MRRKLPESEQLSFVQLTLDRWRARRCSASEDGPGYAWLNSVAVACLSILHNPAASSRPIQPRRSLGLPATPVLPPPVFSDPTRSVRLPGFAGLVQLTMQGNRPPPAAECCAPACTVHDHGVGEWDRRGARLRPAANTGSLASPMAPVSDRRVASHAASATLRRSRAIFSVISAPLAVGSPKYRHMLV